MLFTVVMKKNLVYLFASFLFSVLIFSCSNNKDDEFSERVKISLRGVGNQLLLSNQDSTSLIFPVLALVLCSFQTNNTSLEELLQKVLETEELGEHLAKDETGQFLPIIIASNQIIPNQLNLKHQGKAVTISEVTSLSPNTQVSVLELTGLKVKKKKLNVKHL